VIGTENIHKKYREIQKNTEKCREKVKGRDVENRIQRSECRGRV